MYLAAFALLSVVGTWIAWRRNPLYSTRHTIQFVGGVGLAVCVILALIITAANLTEKSSVVVASTTLFLATLLGTLFLVWIVIAMSSPPAPKLPAATKLVAVHRAKVGLWASRFGIALAIMGFFAIVMPGEWKIMIGIVAGMTALIGVVGIFAGFIAALGLDRSLTAVEEAPWVHWTYPPDRWKAWSDEQIARTVATPPHWIWKRDWKNLVIPIGVTVCGVYALDPGSWQWKTVFLLGIAAFSAAAIAASNRYEKTAPYRLRALMLHSPLETYFGAGGVFAGGTYLQWQTTGIWLTEASIDERAPRSLLFQFEKIQTNAGPVEVRQRVLIPDNASRDIGTLQTLLSQACPTANVRLA